MMDRYGSNDYDTPQGSEGFDLPEAGDAGIEAPPMIGTDERRMHVRAYNYWVSLLDGRAYPAIEELAPDHDDFGPNAVLLDFSTGSDNPSISFLGDALRDECEIADNIQAIADVPARSLLSRLTDHYLQIIANRAPIGFEAEYVNHRDNNTMYRGILMPFSSDDDTIDFIYGVINWKEVADQTTEDAIKDQLRRSLDAPVERQPVEPVAAWADGPSAIGELSTAPAFGPGYGESVDDDPLELTSQFNPDGSEELADWLCAARDLAMVARTADVRSRTALYRTLSLAYDFALAADVRKQDFAEILNDSGIKAQERAPMTPVVKLVFGADYDKTRLAEFSAALTYAKRLGVGRGGLEARIESFDGGLKGFVAAYRAERRPVRMAIKPPVDLSKVRNLPTVGVVDFAGDSEFVLLVARRVDEGRVAIIGTACGDDAMLDRALNQLNG
jgi:hypothetical protein